MDNQVIILRVSTISKSRTVILICEPDNRLFLTLKEDNKCGRSIEDRQFENIMETEMVKNEQGYWEASLPFKQNRQYYHITNNSR